MKVNKKAILGMLVAMVMSLGITTGINQGYSKSENTNLIQITLSCAHNTTTTESSIGGTGWTTAGAIAGGAAAYFYKGAIVSAATGVGAPVAIANALLGGICTL